MKRITIPTDLSSVEENEELTIDMSELNFDVDNSKKKFFSFIYIRNSGIKMKLDFSKCSYKDKEEFLILFMTSGIEVKSDILASTWLEILFNSYQVTLDSILTTDEIRKFNIDHSEYISLIRQFINSIPLYAMYVFHEEGKEPMNLDEFDRSDFNEISLCNFYQLTAFADFILLLEDVNTDNKAVFYEKIFDNPDDCFYLSIIINNLPYLRFLDLLFETPDAQEAFIEVLNNVMKKEEINNGEC